MTCCRRPTAGPSSTATTGSATIADWARFFFAEICSEPHSTKTIEDATGWALDTSVEVMLAEHGAPFDLTADEVEAIRAGR